MRSQQLSVAGITALLMMSSTTAADDAVKTGLKETSYLEEIVVTATRSEKRIQYSPYTINVMNQAAMENQSADQLADVLRDLPGMLVSDSGQAGQKRLRLRGEEARRMALLIDGQEFLDHREVGVPLLVDPNLIQRIEVVRGPASVLYGAKAMGGVINVVTRQQPDQLIGGQFSTSYNQATQGHNVAARLGGRTGPLLWSAAISDNRHQERKTPDGLIENTAYNNHAEMVQLGYHGEQHDLTLNLESFAAQADVWVAPEVRFTAPFLDFGIDIPIRDRDKLSLSWQMTPALTWLDHVSADVYQQTSDRVFNTLTSMALGPGMVMNSDIKTNSQLISDGANIQLNISPSADHQLVTGIQYLRDHLDQVRNRKVEVNGNSRPEETVNDIASLASIAIYLQDDWQLMDGWSLLTGIRSYQVDGELGYSDRSTRRPTFSDEHWLASIALVYAPSQTLTWRINYAEGYLFPSLLNLTAGAYAGSRFVNPDPDLSPETSTSVEAGVRWQHDAFSLDTAIFNSNSENYIDHVFCAAEDACLTSRDKIYKNAGDANAFGLEVSLTYQASYFSLFSNATLMKRKVHDTYMSGTPNFSGLLGINFHYAADHEITLRFEGPSKLYELTGHGPELTNYPSFVIMDAKTSWNWRQLKLIASLNNITDKAYASASENLLAPERHFTLRALFKF